MDNKTLFAGDEVSALVIDVGTHSVKAGYAGEDTPKAVFPTHIGILDETATYTNTIASGMDVDAPMGLAGPADKRRYYCGVNRLGRRDDMAVHSPLHQGLVQDFDLLEKLYEHALVERMGMLPREHPILVTEPSFNTKEIRERIAELFFEKYDVPAYFVCKEPVCSCFASGRGTGLVLDVGGDLSTATPVYDGYVLKKGIVRSALAGNRVSDELLLALQKKGVEVNPRYMVSRTVLPDGTSSVEVKQYPQTTASYRRFALRRTIDDMKESTCRVSDLPFDEQINASIPSIDYEIPGRVIEVGTERFSVPECLFRPEGLADQSNIAGEDALVGLHQVVQKSILACDVDMRRELYGNLIVCGGTTLMQGFTERLNRELTTLAPLQKLKIIASNNSIEKSFSVWLGGSILGSLGSFQQMWVSKEEFGEYGRNIVERKCP